MPLSLPQLLRPLLRTPSSRIAQRVDINVVVLATRAAILAPPRTPRAFFSSTNSPPPLSKNVNLPPRPKPPPDEEIEEAFLKGSGPGGQKINKTNSAVQLKHLPTGIVVKCQATRSRSQNRKIARQLLADKVDDKLRGDESRSAIVGEVKRKRKASSAKKSRRKYRKLGEEEGGEEKEEEEQKVELDSQEEIILENDKEAKVEEHSPDPGIPIDKPK